MTLIKKTVICVALGEVYAHNTLFSVLPFSIVSGTRLQELLVGAGWSLKTFLFDQHATKEAIEIALGEAIRNAAEDEWLLFYFVGHGYWLPSHAGPSAHTEFFVSYTDHWKESRFPRLTDYMTGEIYSSLILQFLKEKPNRHFISVLDCCYADGMIDSIPLSANHTLFAASSSNSKAYADFNSSFFFRAFDALFYSCKIFTELSEQLEHAMKKMAPPGVAINSPVVRLAQNFTTNYF